MKLINNVPYFRRLLREEWVIFPSIYIFYFSVDIGKLNSQIWRQISLIVYFGSVAE
jgi:hypothetical protein